MEVHVVADDPVREAVVTALSDVDVSVTESSVRDLAEASVAVVADVATSEIFKQVNAVAKDSGLTWLAIAIGGVGGQSIRDVDASVTGFSPETGCYDCLCARVTASRDQYVTTANPRGERAAARLAGAIAGRELVRLLSSDDETSILGSVIELPYVEREFLPIPICRCHAHERDRSISLDDEALSFENTVVAAERAVDDRVGLATSIGEVESFPAPYYLSQLPNTRAYSEAKAPQKAAGVDEDWNVAFVKAIGEGLERYCAGVYRNMELTEAALADLTGAVDPETFVRPDDAPTVDPDAEYPWVEGEHLATEESVMLPADAVHFPQPGEGIVAQITTGLGLGTSVADAIVSGLTEVLERDAAMISWYSTDEPVGLSVDDPVFERLERRARGEDLAVTPLLVTQDVDVPVVTVAVHRDDREWPAFAVGSAADLDGVAAARSALAEAIQNWMELRSIGQEDAEEAGAWIGEYASFPEAAQTFVDVDRTVDAASLGPSEELEGAAAVEELVERTVEEGLTPYATRLTTRDVAELGFEAVRVVIPEAQPLFTDEPFFGERAETVPESLGFEARLDREPHPYP